MARRRLPLTTPPEALDREQKAKMMAWAYANYPKLVPALGRLWHKCRDWHLANGVLRADWEATFRNWIRQEQKFSQREATRRDPERRQRDLEELAEVIPMWTRR